MPTTAIAGYQSSSRSERRTRSTANSYGSRSWFIGGSSRSKYPDGIAIRAFDPDCPGVRCESLSLCGLRGGWQPRLGSRASSN
uniref:Uncharacterized protein n=1 Tax=Macrostomum lignano TaxID=282301 RepID=A0A1I8F8D2_9PLAT